MIKRVLWLSVWVWLGLVATTSLRAAMPPILPVDQLQPGMHGKTLTVMQGTQIVELDTEVLGVQRNALGPGKDLIIAKLVDEKTKLTEAVHGMSGSPLYIDGKLVGALSRRLGDFEKDGHCGFTPIADMIDVGKRPNALADGGNPVTLVAGKDGVLVPQCRSVTGPGGFLSLPLAISGWNDRLQSLLAPMFPANGLLTPVPGGSGGNTVPGAAIVPGAPLAVVLISGDISVAGTGTVTAVDGDHVLAFGHPMFGFGAVDMPFAQAEIISVLPSYSMPYKLSNTGKMVGTLHQDRLSAVAGELGKLPPLASYEIDFTHDHEKRPPARGELVTDYRLVPMLLPLLMATALDGGQDFSTNFTMRLQGQIDFAGLPPLKLDGLYSGQASERSDALFDMVRPVLLLYGQFPKKLKLNSIKLSVDSYEKDQVWYVDSVSVDKTKLKPLDTLRVIVRLKNDAGQFKETEFNTKLSEQLKDGQAVVRVASGMDLQRDQWRRTRLFAADTPEQLIQASQREFRNDGLYLQILTKGTGISRPDQQQPDLPPSVAAVNRSNALVKDYVNEMPQVWVQQENVLPGVVFGGDEVPITIQQ